MKDEKDKRFLVIFLRKAQNKLRDRFLFRVLSRVSWAILFFLVLALSVHTQAPQWWFTRGAVDTNLTPNDYAPITHGQLKWMATNAFLEMEAHFGAGPNVTAVVGAFSDAGNYDVAKIGQVKYLAMPFYDRLYELNLTNTFPANMPGYYPWGQAPATNDYAPATIGQAKYVFSFDSAVDTDLDGISDWWEVTLGTDPYIPSEDTDSDWLPDWWEDQWFGNLAYDADDDPDCDGFSNLQEYLNGTDPTTFTIANTIIAWGNNDNGQTDVPAGLNNVMMIAAGMEHSLALKSNGTVVAWGRNDYGQASVPEGLSNVKMIAAGFLHSLALKADGTVVAWGYGLPVDVPFGLNEVIAIAAQEMNSLALKSNGTVVAWGNNYAGQTNVPEGLSNVIAIAAGGIHNLALKADGTVVAWGDNHSGQMDVPGGLNNVIAIAAGSAHNLALKADGTVVAWGQVSVPEGLSNVIAIAAGSYHSLALKADGTVVAWGWNDYGQASVPEGLGNAAAITAGEMHSMALVNTGVRSSIVRVEFSAPTAIKPWTTNGVYDAKANLTADSCRTRLAWHVGTLIGNSKASIDTNGLVTFGAGGGRYRIAVNLAALPGAQLIHDEMILDVIKVAFRTNFYEAALSTNSFEASANLTADTFNPTNLSWSLTTVTGATASIDENTGTVTCPIEGGEYRIQAASRDLPGVTAEMIAKAQKLNVAFSTNTAIVAWQSNGYFEAGALLQPGAGRLDRLNWSLSNVVGDATASINATDGLVTFGATGGIYAVHVASLDLPELQADLSLTVVKIDIDVAPFIQLDGRTLFAITVEPSVPLTLMLEPQDTGEAQFEDGEYTRVISGSTNLMLLGAGVSTMMDDIILRGLSATGSELFRQPVTVATLNFVVQDAVGRSETLNSLDIESRPLAIVNTGDVVTITVSSQPEGLIEGMTWRTSPGGEPSSGFGPVIQVSFHSGDEQICIYGADGRQLVCVQIIAVTISEFRVYDALFNYWDWMGWRLYNSPSFDLETEPPGFEDYVALVSCPITRPSQYTPFGPLFYERNGATVTNLDGSVPGWHEGTASIGTCSTSVVYHMDWDNDEPVIGFNQLPGCGEARFYVIRTDTYRNTRYGLELISWTNSIENPWVGDSLSWSISDHDPGVRATIDANGYLFLEQGSEAGWVTVAAHFLQFKYDIPSGSYGYYDSAVSIPYYAGARCTGDCGPGGGNPRNKCVDMRFSLGSDAIGGFTGNLMFRSSAPVAALGTPAMLGVGANYNIEVVRSVSDRAIRQVKAPQTFVDVVTLDAYSYELNFYDPGSVGARDNAGFFALQGVPHTRWLVENLDQTPDSCYHLRITRDGGDRVIEYNYDPQDNSWTLSEGHGLKRNKLVEQADVSIRTIFDSNNVISAKSVETFADYAWGRGRVKTEVYTTPEDPAPLTTTWAYDAAGRIIAVNNPNGSASTYDYDEQGRLTLSSETWLDTPGAKTTSNAFTPVDPNDAGAERPLQPRTEITRINGIEVGRTYYAYYINATAERVELVERAASAGAPYGAAGNLRTISIYYPSVTSAQGIDTVWADQLKEIRYPDGRMDSHVYEAGVYDASTRVFTPNASSTNAVRHSVIHGLVSAPEGVAYQTTCERTVTDAKGNAVYEETLVFNGSSYEQLTWKTHAYDEKGHVIKTLASDFSEVDQSWACCGLDFSTDENGIQYDYAYDAVGRLISKTKLAAAPLVTTFALDASDRVLLQTVSAGGLSLVTSNAYDLAGRLLRSIDAAGVVTAHSYEDGGRRTVTTLPDTRQRISETYQDGQSKSEMWEGRGQFYEYGVNADGSQWTKVYNGSPTSPNWEKTTTDFLGRTAKVERPEYSTTTEVTENFYNNKGQLIRQSTANSPQSLFAYDSLGNQIRSGLDLNNNGVLDLAGSDRITESDTSYELMSGVWYLTSVSRLYATDNSAETITNSITRKRLTGLPVAGVGDPGIVAVTITIDARGNETWITTEISRANKEVSRQTTYLSITPPLSSYESTLTRNGLLVGSIDRQGLSHQVVYDALEREIERQEPGGLVSRTHYNALGQVDYVEDAEGNRTTFTYDSSTGRKTAQTDPLTNTSYSSYSSHDEQEKTWGSAVYPVWYEYDIYGRTVKMHTYRDPATPELWSGETWPGGEGDLTTWQYDEASALLTNKADAAANSVSYTYDSANRLASRTWARKVDADLRAAYSYNSAGDLIGIAYSGSPATPDVSFTYDRLGRATTISDGVGARTFTYSGLDLAAETVPLPDGSTRTITRSFDVAGRLTGLQLSAGPQIRYWYTEPTEDKNRMSFVEFDSGDGTLYLAQYVYHPDRNLLSQTDLYREGDWVNLLQVTRGYEPRRDLLTNVTTVAMPATAPAPVSRFDYVLDSVGRRVERVDLLALTNLFGYNPRSELTSAAMGSNNYGYAYDPIGNRLWAAANAESNDYTANTLNQYFLITNQLSQIGNDLGYDADGNLTNDSVLAYSWDGENRMVMAEPLAPTGGAQRVRNAYDYMSRRVEKAVDTWDGSAWTGDSTNYFLYDGWNLIQELQSTAYGLQTNSYVWGQDLSGSLQGAGGVGGLLCVIHNGTPYFPCYDGNGNVTDYMDTNGVVVAHREYDAYGNTIVATGPMVNDFHFWFSTKYLDAETGLYYYGYRYYSPSLGRWLSRDLSGEMDLNLYCFVNNDAVRIIDMLGLWGFNVHDVRTRDLAITMGYTEKSGLVIGHADNAVDSGINNPITSDRSWHFNRAGAGSDSRINNFIEYMKKAKELCNKRNDKPEESADKLGASLHPLQDYVAHGDFTGEYIHNAKSPQKEFGDPSGYPDDITLDAGGPHGRVIRRDISLIVWGAWTFEYTTFHRGRERIRYTDERTRIALQDFLNYVKTSGGCNCKKYFFIQMVLFPGFWIRLKRGLKCGLKWFVTSFLACTILFSLLVCFAPRIHAIGTIAYVLVLPMNYFHELIFPTFNVSHETISKIIRPILFVFPYAILGFIVGFIRGVIVQRDCASSKGRRVQREK